MGLWVIDLDGVVWRGPEAVPGSPDAVASLLERGDRVVFCTNDAAGPADITRGHEIGRASCRERVSSPV